MGGEILPDDVRRFILTSIRSVPHLEALLLLRGEPHTEWDAARVSGRLYVTEKVAAELLADLNAAGLVAGLATDGQGYCYLPTSPDLGKMVDKVAQAYSTRLVDVTNLIHSTAGTKVQQFADVFRFRKDS